MKTLKAKTIGELIERLQEIADEHGENCTWNGWDDESVIIRNETEGDFAAVQPE